MCSLLQGTKCDRQLKLYHNVQFALEYFCLKVWRKFKKLHATQSDTQTSLFESGLQAGSLSNRDKYSRRVILLTPPTFVKLPWTLAPPSEWRYWHVSARVRSIVA